LPLKGLKGNVSNLSHYVLQKFQLENITPNKIWVCAAGVENHEEFLDLVGDKLNFIPATQGQTTKQREKSEYSGGEVRNLTEDNTSSIGLYFNGASWSN